MDQDATLTIAEARDRLADLVERAAEGKDRVVLTREGAPRAALVPIEDLEALEALEDARDAEEARRRLEEWEREGRSTVTLEKLTAEYGIDLGKDAEQVAGPHPALCIDRDGRALWAREASQGPKDP